MLYDDFDTYDLKNSIIPSILDIFYFTKIHSSTFFQTIILS